MVRFYRRFSPACDASHVSLFRRDQGTGGVEDDLATHLLAQDLIYVGGGNVVSMLGAWRAHGLDAILRKAWRRGIVLCGPVGRLAVLVRAGAERVPWRAARVRGLGLLPYSNCVHYDAEPAAARRVPPLRRRRHARRLRRRRRRRAALSRARAWCAPSQLAPDGRAYRVEPNRAAVACASAR